MQLVTVDTPGFQKSEFGAFWLKPDEGWDFSQQFIDFESGLLIVSVSVKDKAKWADTGFGSYTIPSKEFRIDVKKREILPREVWATYFNYNKTETLSDDGKYKLITRRVYNPNRDSDGIEEELWDVEKNTKISSGSGIAFTDERRENLLDEHYRHRRERQEYMDRENAKLTLTQLLQQELTKLTDGTLIWEYGTDTQRFQLRFSGGKFGIWTQKTLTSWFTKSEKFVLEKTFANLDDFWAYWTKNETWYTTYRLFAASSNLLVMVYYVVDYFNGLRKNHRFSFRGYNAINAWENEHHTDVLRRTEYRQWCPNCHQETTYFPRYPKAVCGACASKEKRDENGTRVEFYNTGISGGFKIVYLDEAGQTIREDDTQPGCVCYIDSKKFFADEARFGGTVIQCWEEGME